MFQKVTDLPALELIANQVRQDILNMLLLAGSGHQGGPLGMTDIFVALYLAVINHDPQNPSWSDRDRVVLSNGHICPVWYAALAHAGYFPHEELATLRKLNSRLQGHPHYGTTPGVENTGGPLGQGLSQAVGMALTGKMDKKRFRVYAIMSDAEQQEGQTMEAMMFAGNNRLDNLVGIIDRNNIQIDGNTEDVMPLEPLVDKYQAYKWHVFEIDGHNFREIIEACEHAKSIHDRPTVIIAHTIPGRGVSLMENNYLWHSRPMKPAEHAEAIEELLNYGGKKWGVHHLK